MFYQDPTGSTSPPRKLRSLVDIYQSCDFVCFATEPTCFEDAAREKDWHNAMEVEMNAIEKNKTWRLVDLPRGKEAIGLKWIYKSKFNADGSLQKHKARLVAKGYAQVPGVDFFETFSPITRIDTIRTILAVAALKGWKIFQFDVKSTFLNGELQEEVYVEQPPGFEIKGSENKVYKLKKTLYGLKQAP